jgi:hypothetical protein
VIEGYHLQLRSITLATLVLLIPLKAHADPAGKWIGKVHADRAIMLARAKSPEHHKLLAYALTRVENADVKLELQPDHTFHWTFDDHYAPDLRTLDGQWNDAKGGFTIVLLKGNHGSTKYPDTHVLKTSPDGKTTLSSPLFAMPKGFTVVYHRVP